MQHTATHCNTLHHTAPHCNTLQHNAAQTTCTRTARYITCCNTLHHTAIHCNTLQQTATLCSTLQHRQSARELHVMTSYTTLYHAELHCAHCNTLQHTATYCNADDLHENCTLHDVLLLATKTREMAAMSVRDDERPELLLLSREVCAP